MPGIYLNKLPDFVHNIPIHYYLFNLKNCNFMEGNILCYEIT